jgi:chemotaxis signal transduction protein
MKLHAPMIASADQLRRAFDETFARVPEPQSSDDEEVLNIRLGNDLYVLRLREIAGVYVEHKLVPLPGPMAELLGIAAIRGVLVPVYDLGALLGYRVNAGLRGFVLARSKSPVGFACGTPERLQRLPRASFANSEEVGAERPHLSGLVRISDTLRPVVDMESLVQTIEKATTLHARSRE